jgi:hypothetical protein
MINDALNGAFESIGGVCIWFNVRRLARDKSVRGVDWRITGLGYLELLVLPEPSSMGELCRRSPRAIVPGWRSPSSTARHERIY